MFNSLNIIIICPNCYLVHGIKHVFYITIINFIIFLNFYTKVFWCRAKSYTSPSTCVNSKFPVKFKFDFLKRLSLEVFFNLPFTNSSHFKKFPFQNPFFRPNHYRLAQVYSISSPINYSWTFNLAPGIIYEFFFQRPLTEIFQLHIGVVKPFFFNQPF